MKKCTILVCSCDAYSDLWEPFFRLMKEYWQDCEFDVVLNTETKICPDYGVAVTQYPKERMKKWAYGKRMRYHLSKIKTPYTMILLDDFFLRRKVETDKINDLIDYLDHDKRAVVFSLQNVIDSNNVPSEKYAGFSKRPRKGSYKFNLQAAIWRTKQLKRFWKNHESPWEWEEYGNDRSTYPSCAKKYDFYVLEDDLNTPFYYGFDLQGMGVFRGKWVYLDVAELFAKHNIEVDYSKRGLYDPQKDIPKHLKTSEWKKVKCWGLLHYIKNKLTPLIHDLKCQMSVFVRKTKEFGFFRAIGMTIRHIFKPKK